MGCIPDVCLVVTSFYSRIVLFRLQGACVFASGSPFKPVKIGDKTHYPGQANNAYIFPGVALAVISCGVHHIPEIVFFKAAQVSTLGKTYCYLFLRAAQLRTLGKTYCYIFLKAAQVRTLGKSYCYIFLKAAQVRTLGKSDCYIFLPAAQVRTLGKSYCYIFLPAAQVRTLGKSDCYIFLKAAHIPVSTEAPGRPISGTPGAGSNFLESGARRGRPRLDPICWIAPGGRDTRRRQFLFFSFFLILHRRGLLTSAGRELQWIRGHLLSCC